MNPDAPTPPPRPSVPTFVDAETVAAAQKAIAAILVSLGEGWRVIPAPGAVTVTRGWEEPEGWVDTLVIASPKAAYANREDPGGIERWRMAGTADKVAAAVRDLPPPPEVPGAPDGTEHTPGPSGLWRP